MNQQTVVLQKQIEKLKNEQMRLVKSFKHQTDMLSKLIIRLARFYQNVNPNLDQELMALSSHLGGKANFALAEKSVKKINNLLLQDVDYFKHHQQKTLALLVNSAKRLQADSHSNDKTVKHSLSFLADISDINGFQFNMLPMFEQVLKLYSDALSHCHSSSSFKPSDDSRRSEDLHKNISLELQYLIDQLLIRHPNHHELQPVKQKLLGGISHPQLLDCCLLIIRTILKDAVQDGHYAEQFVHSMQQSLVNMHQSIDESIELQTDRGKVKQQLQQQVKAQILDLSDTLKEATDLEQLKRDTNQYLNKLTNALESHEQVDEQDQQQLIQLLHAMQNQLNHMQQQTSQYQIRLAEQQSNQLTDPLTQIPNRMAYSQRIEAEVNNWKEQNKPFCIALADIDYFKRINDNYGHTAGDRSLQAIAKTIQSCLKRTDFIARWGGEEFVLIFPQTSKQQLTHPLEEIRQQVQRIPFTFKNKNVSVTVSIGATEFTSQDTIATAFERADQALYQAKSKGRNRIIIN